MRVAGVFRKRDRLTQAKLDHINRPRPARTAAISKQADHAELTALREQVRSLQARLAKMTQGT